MSSKYAPKQISTTEVSILSTIAFYMIAVSSSPLLSGPLSLNPNLISLAALTIFLASAARARGLNRKMLLLWGALTAASFTLLVFSQSTLLWKRTFPIGLLLLATHLIVNIKNLPESICDMLSKWLALGVILSIIGFIYALSGGQPVLSITNPDGRENHLYLTTMSGAVYGNVIRPAWIYDEPGAFSFLICSTVAFRHLLRMNNRLSTFLMIGGLVTLSLAHMIVAALYMITRYGSWRTAISLTAIIVAFSIVAQRFDNFEFLIARFAIEDGRLAGDNRSNQIDNFFNVVDPRMMLLGNVDCHTRQEGSCHEHGDISSSPVTPVYHGGVFLLAVQLATQLALVIAFFIRRNTKFSAAAMSVLLLQRPYFADFSYGLIIYTTLFMMFREKQVRYETSPKKTIVLTPKRIH